MFRYFLFLFFQFCRVLRRGAQMSCRDSTNNYLVSAWACQRRFALYYCLKIIWNYHKLMFTVDGEWCFWIIRIISSTTFGTFSASLAWIVKVSNRVRFELFAHLTKSNRHKYIDQRIHTHIHAQTQYRTWLVSVGGNWQKREEKKIGFSSRRSTAIEYKFHLFYCDVGLRHSGSGFGI